MEKGRIMDAQQHNRRRLLAAFGDFRRTWPQLLITYLLSLVFAVLMITPLVGALLKIFLTQVKDGVLADADIALFLLHPTGMAALVVVGAVSLGVVFVEQGVLMVIGFGAVEDRRVTWLDAARYVGRHAFGMVTLAGQVLVRLLLVAAPFLAGVGLVYLVFLTEHDINFYLVDKPPEWWWAVAWAALLLTGLAVIVLRMFSGWILSLAMVLFEGLRGRRALRQSTEMTAPYRWRIVLLLAAWLVGIGLLGVSVTYLIGLLGGMLIPDFSGNPLLVALGLGATLLVAGTVNLGLSIVATAIFALLIVRLYRLLAGPGRCEPELAARGSLGGKAQLAVPGKKIIWSGAAALVVVVIGVHIASTGVEDKYEDASSVDIIAHRGASGSAPENTLAAFQRAIDEKADWIELDVQESADGVVVVAHDSDFMKVARDGTKVWEATSEALSRIDIGSWFGAEFSDQRVPTLREALELAKDKLGVVIELKYYGHDHDLESRVVDVVEETGMAPQIQIMSLKAAGLRKSAALRPSWPHGLLNTASVGDLTKLEVDFLALNGAAATWAMIRAAHKKKMKIYVWTINDPVQMLVMLGRGVDGIITDEPALTKQLVEFRDQLSPLARLLVWIAGETSLLPDADVFSTAQDA
jgi:glycerophosphoryl diester phosphodiesterase